MFYMLSLKRKRDKKIFFNKKLWGTFPIIYFSLCFSPFKSYTPYPVARVKNFTAIFDSSLSLLPNPSANHVVLYLQHRLNHLRVPPSLPL